MIDFLTAKVYELYPRNISGIDNTYSKTKAFINLRSTLKKRIDEDYNSWKDLIEELSSKTLHILDKTSFTTNQPSLTFELILENKANTANVIHLYYSGFIPYFYYVHVVHNLKSNLAVKEVSVNHPEAFQYTGVDVVPLVREKFKIELFPEEYLNIKIPDISFEAIKRGDFTFKNAFFNTRHLFI